jgi:hypothetical protein
MEEVQNQYWTVFYMFKNRSGKKSVFIFRLLILVPARPAKPALKRSIVAGSGTGSVSGLVSF